MKSITCVCIFFLVSNLVFGQITYTFIGSGNWTDSANWQNRIIPPAVLPIGSTININSANCVLNVAQTISVGAYLNLSNGSNIIVPENLNFGPPCQGSYDGIFTDPRDGQQYPFKQIGTQIWMTKNLNYAAPGSWCYNDTAFYCETYGRLYDWNTAMTAAPTGWHIPSDVEWDRLRLYLGGEYLAGGAMKSNCSLWENPNINATNSSGWSGLPGDYRAAPGNPQDRFIGRLGLWWSSSEMCCSYTSAVDIYLTKSDSIFHFSGTTKLAGLSVRCIRD